MQRLKFLQQRRQSPPAEGKRRSDTQKSARGVAPASSLYLCLVNIGETTHAPDVKRRPFFGERQGARGAVGQAYTETRLETRKGPAHDRKRQAKIACRSRQAARFHDTPEHDHIEKLVGHILTIIARNLLSQWLLLLPKRECISVS